MVNFFVKQVKNNNFVVVSGIILAKNPEGENFIHRRDEQLSYGLLLC